MPVLGARGAIPGVKVAAKPLPKSPLAGFRGETSTVGAKPNPAMGAPRIKGVPINTPKGQKLFQANAPKIPHQTMHPLTPREIKFRAEGLGNIKVPEEAETFNPLKTIENVPGSVARFIPATFAGAVKAGEAGVGLAKGETKQAGEFVKGVAQTFEHPLRSLETEPVGTSAMFLAPEEALGKLGTVAAKTGMLGEKAATLADYTREPVKLYNGLTLPAEHTDNLIKKGAQSLADNYRARVLRHDPSQAEGSRMQRALYGGGVISHVIKAKTGRPIAGWLKPGMVDKLVGQGRKGLVNLYRTMHKEVLHATLEQHGLLKDPSAEAIPLIMEHTINSPQTVTRDLSHRLQMLRESAKGLYDTALDQNLRQQEQIQKLLQNKAFVKDPSRHFAVAEKLTDFQKQWDLEKIAAGVLEPKQLEAKYVPYAVNEMGLHYNAEPGRHPIVGQLRDARKAVKAAEKEKARARGEVEGARLPAGVRAGPNFRSQRADRALKEARTTRNQLKDEMRQMVESRALKNNKGEQWGHLEDASGKRVSFEEVAQHMHEHYGPREPGFITHRAEGLNSSGSTKLGGRPAVATRERTGVSYADGTYDSSFHGLEKQFERTAVSLGLHHTENYLHNAFTFGNFKKAEDALKWIEAYGPRLRPYLGDIVPVNRGPNKILDEMNLKGNPGHDILEQFGVPEDRAAQELGGLAKWGIQPKVVADRIKEHDKLAGETGRSVLESVTGRWRHATLYSTPRWPVGVSQENAIRLGFYGMSPLAMIPGLTKANIVGKNIMDEYGLLGGWDQRAALVDPTVPPETKVAARMQLGAIGAGSFIGGEILKDMPKMEDLLPSERTDLEKFKESKWGPAQALKAWEWNKDKIGNFLSAVEKQTRTAVIGKMAINDTRALGKDVRALVKNEGDLIHQWAEGTLAPSDMAAFAERLFKAVGNWNHLTPSVAKARATWSPFGLWWLNSMKFVFQTLPADHPMKTAALAAMVIGTGANKTKVGQPEWENGDLVVDLPFLGKISLNPLHYSPFDIAREPNVKAEEMVLPEAEEGLDLVRGINSFTGNKTEAPWTTDIFKAGENAGMSMFPFARPAVEIARQGGKPEEKSIFPWATKPGTQTGIGKAFAKYLSLVPFTYSKAEPTSGLRSVGLRGADPLRKAGPIRKAALRKP